MATSIRSSSDFYTTALENHLAAMARTVEGSVNRSFEALLSWNAEIASAVFVTEPKINESEILVDEHAIRLLRSGDLSQEDVRHIVATLKINNDLERMGDLAVNICQCVISMC